jgi:acyl phosphate:glycerol-3-phosphate acyltransferase
MLKLLVMVFISYLVGSFPTAIIYGKLTRGIDIRQHGSGNAGATNVFRVLGWKAGVFVLLIDMAKGLIATLWFYKIGNGSFIGNLELLKILAGLSAVFGHIWTVFARFKGGKGVGTGAGMIIGLVPGAVLVAVIVFLVVVGFSRWVSLGSILASITIPVYLFLKRFLLMLPVSNTLLIFGLLIPVLIIFTHRSNIKRLLNGAENKITFKK